MIVSEAARLRILMDKHQRLKKLRAGSTLDVSALKYPVEKEADPVCGSLRCGGDADD